MHTFIELCVHLQTNESFQIINQSNQLIEHHSIGRIDFSTAKSTLSGIFFAENEKAYSPPQKEPTHTQKSTYQRINN